MLSELAPGEEVEKAIEAYDAAEEEGSSSNPEKEDEEDGRGTDVAQVINVPAGQLEVFPVSMQLERVDTLPRDQSLVVIEESVPEEGGQSCEILGAEPEVQTVPPAATSSRGPPSDRRPAFV